VHGTSAATHSVSVAGIVVNAQGRVLVVQRRDDGSWQPPGGILERGETFEEGLVREVAEESGVVVEVDRLTGVYKDVRRDIVALVFRCHPIGRGERDDDETAAVGWMTRDEVIERVEHVFAVRVLDAIDDLHDARYRSHDGQRLTA
jgi:8-oxo-dGTP diphosphatase